MKTIASIALALGCASAMAQSGPPSDVPKDHWAYPAVENLFRLGILKGYPDGSFKGSRPATRFEMAGALNAAFTDIKNITDGLDLQVNPRGMPAGEFASITELVTLRRDMDSLRADIGTVRATKTEVEGLNRDFGSMSDQLRRIREDLAQMREKLNKTKNRP
ncbi:MAG: S-layer homology domain-containing protein [Fimbriimonas sp.]